MFLDNLLGLLFQTNGWSNVFLNLIWDRKSVPYVKTSFMAKCLWRCVSMPEQTNRLQGTQKNVARPCTGELFLWILESEIHLSFKKNPNEISKVFAQVTLKEN